MKQGVNYYFLSAVAILIVFGMAFLATLSAIESLKLFGNTNYYLFHQLTTLSIGIVAAIIAFKVPLGFIKKVSLPLLIVNLILLAVVFVPMVGLKFWGAQRWINIGGNTIQPSEFLKISAILYLSAFLSNKLPTYTKKGIASVAKKSYDNIIHVFFPFLCLLGVITALLLLQRDLSTLGITSIALATVYFISGTPLWHTIFLLVSGISGILLLIKVEPYRVERFLVFLHPEADPLGIGFQLKQSILAVGSGGIFGKGLGMSTQKFGYLPQAMSDSVFAILAEETGIVGGTVVILLFAFFAWQAIKIARNATDKFASLAAVGICTWITTQAFINIASAIGIFPLAGIPLPFFSYGGSHVIAELIGVGLILNISKNG